MSQGLCVLISFVFGSIPFGWIFARLWGVKDLRKEGSHNIGATNVVRTLGWGPGVLTFLFDFLKGVLPMLFLHCESGVCTESHLIFGVAAVLGHCYSPFLSFRGGKGVSTYLGMMVALDWRLGIAAVAAYVLGLVSFRVSALGSLFALITGLTGELLFGTLLSDRFMVLAVVLLIISRHRKNWEDILEKSVSKAASAIGFLTLLGLGLAAGKPARATGFPIELRDFQNTPVRIEKRPEKSVALIPSLGESLVALGFGETLVGVPQYTNLPASLKKKVRELGPYNALSAEMIYSLRPDVVFASKDGNDAALVGKLRELNIPVLVMDNASLRDIGKTLRLMAKAFGEEKNHAIADFEKSVMRDPVQKNGKGSLPRVFVQIGWEPLVTVGTGTFLDEMIRNAGGLNVFGNFSSGVSNGASTRYPRPNPEQVVKYNPDVIVICRMTPEGNEAEKAREFWRRFPKISAVQSGRVFIVPGDVLIKPGFSLIEGMSELRKILRGTS